MKNVPDKTVSAVPMPDLSLIYGRIHTHDYDVGKQSSINIINH